MSEEITKVPAIRFKGFTDPWEQCKVGDVFTERSERYGEGELISVTINSGVVKASELDRKDNSSDNKSNYKKVEVGDIAYNSMRMWQGASGYSPYSGILSPAYTVITPKDGIDSKFFAYNFKRNNMIQAFKRNSQGLTSDTWNLKFPTLKSVKIIAPSFIEQQLVSRFFESMDQAITLQQRELDLMKKQKKTLLSKMFPKIGEQFPEIRFKGFTDPWEQCKLKDVTKRVQANDGRMDLPTLTISAGNGWMNQVDRFSGNIAGNEQKNYTLLKKGQLSYNHGNSKLAKYGAVFELRNYEEALVPRVYHSFEMTEGSAGFIDYMFSTKLPDRELGKLVSSGARMDGLLNINYDDFSNITIRIPSPVEQDQITSFLRQFDQAITLQQRKLDQMKIIKKSLLKAMFV